MAEEQNKASVTQESEASKQPVQKSSGGSSKTVWIIIIVVLVVIIALAGVGYYFVKKAANKVAEVGTYSSTFSAGDTQVTAGENQKWPSDISTDVPQFTAGKIKGTGKVGEDYTVMIEGVKDADVTGYKQILTNQGWTIDSETNVEGITSYNASKSGYTVNVMFTSADSSLLISVTKEAV